MLTEYNQPQISVSEQILMLKSEGLDIPDESKAEHIFENISLFRMKSYLIPFQIAETRRFKLGTSFSDVYSLYRFDSELRKIICSELEKIEISIRTQMSLIMSEEAGIYWFENISNFKDASRHAKLLSNLMSELRRSDDTAILDFQHKYANPFPPSWMTFEISSFGTLSMMYSSLKASLSKRNVARFYGLTDTVMESWLHSIVYVRNICAHHSRLWNRKLGINALVPRKTYLPFIKIPFETKKVYYILSILLYFLQTVNPQNGFAGRFKSLLERYPMVDANAMGFPKDWRSEILWQ